MTAIDLRALFADAANGGAYFVDARDREALVETANALQFAVVPIDFSGCRDKDDALARFAQALRFPDWFGGNWDALADCLGDLSWWPAQGYVLLLEHSGEWREHARESQDTALDLLNEIALQWAKAGVPFWALLPLSPQEMDVIGD